MPSKTLKRKKLRQRQTLKGGFLWSKAKVAPLTRTISSPFDLFIDKFNGSIQDETHESDTQKMLAYYSTAEEYKERESELKYPYAEKKLVLTYGDESYPIKHPYTVCDIEPLTRYIAQKRLVDKQSPELEEKIAHGASYIITTILEKIGTDVTTNSVKRFMKQYIWDDTPLVKEKLEKATNQFKQVRYTTGNDLYKGKLKSSIQEYQAVLTGMLCVRILIRKKFDDMGYSIPDELNDVFGGMNSSLFSSPSPSAPTPSQIKTLTPAKNSFVQKCYKGVCKLFGIPH
jgi:hypothetical protein